MLKNHRELDEIILLQLLPIMLRHLKMETECICKDRRTYIMDLIFWFVLKILIIIFLEKEEEIIQNMRIFMLI